MNTSRKNSRRPLLLVLLLAVLLVAGGGFAIAAGISGSPASAAGTPAAASAFPAQSAPASTAPPTPPTPKLPAAAPAKRPTPSSPVLPASVPTTVDIPSVGIHSALLSLGKQADGTLEVPPGEPGSPAGWYRNSPAPGAPGSSIILGHVNSTLSDIGVFYRLHAVAKGQQVSVTRADKSVAVFTVDSVKTYDKASFPTLEVYRNALRPELRLITCDGFDAASGLYLKNTVVFAHLTSTHRS